MNYKGNRQLTLSDRILIEMGIYQRKSFREIARGIGKHPTSIANEIKNNRTRIAGIFPGGKDCRHVRKCREKMLCGDMSCRRNCYTCGRHDCRQLCSKYIQAKCSRCEYPPYVCNVCGMRKRCTSIKYMYSAGHADAASRRRRSKSRQGSRLSHEEYQKLDSLLSELVAKGQPLSHIYSEHGAELPVCLRTVYNYIEKQELSVRAMDLRRKVGYKPRKKAKEHQQGNYQQYREGRTYDDYTRYVEKEKPKDIIEMDTVKGVRERGKRLLTMISTENGVMLLFLLPDGSAASVNRVFDYLEAGIGSENFKRIFQVILTDNGSEFKKADELERSLHRELRTRLFYCDPMASWQKPHIEKNHEFIRYVVPKGKSLNPYTQEDITLLMNHINSIKRDSLGKRAPYELIDKHDEAWIRLMSLLKMHLIPADEVHLRPDLLK